MATQRSRQRRLVDEHPGVQQRYPLLRVLQRRDALGPLVLPVHEGRALGIRERRLAHLSPPRQAGAPARVQPAHAEDHLDLVGIPGRQPARQPELLLTVPHDRGRQRVQRLVIHAGPAPIVVPPRPHLGRVECLYLNLFFGTARSRFLCFFNHVSGKASSLEWITLGKRPELPSLVAVCQLVALCSGMAIALAPSNGS